MNRAARPGDYLIARAGQEPKDGDLVVVERTRSGGPYELSVRRFTDDREKYELSFYSDDFQEALSVDSGRDQDGEVKILGMVLGAHRVLGSVE